MLEACELEKDDCMIAGFDLVCEEETTAPMDSYLDLLLLAKKNNPKLKFFMHAGESVKKNNAELYDAVLLGSKRIGHGFALIKHPNLIE
jgi:adenosine deaminase CECR1